MRALLLTSLMVCLAFAGCLESNTEDLLNSDPANLTFRQAVDLGTDVGLVSIGTSCQDSLDDGDCGLGEPSVEVAGDGSIYITGTCCLVNAPPILVSRDGGETFQDLPGDDVREAFGIEADLAVDDVGRLYVADIEMAGSFQVTVWNADGSYSHHTKWPAPPLVDRDWIRAEGDGIVYYAYNTGTDTLVYKSTDAGRTWSPGPIHMTGYNLGNMAIRPGQELCVAGGGSFLETDCTIDGGDSWTDETSTVPSGGNFPVPSFDEAGTLYLASSPDQTIVYGARTTDGWQEPVTISPAGNHRMPWIAGGHAGALAVAWYGTLDETITANTEWFLFAAVSHDADSEEPTWAWTIADPEPIFVGQLGRDLLDFLQIDVGPDGSLHIAYSKLRAGQGPDGNEEQLHYVRSEPTMLGMESFWYGPHA